MDKGTRKRASRSAMDNVEKKHKQSEVLLKSPLFGAPPNDVGSGLARSPLFGGKPEKTVVGISDLTIGSYRNASINGRVSFIGDITEWDNGRSQGKVLSFGILNQQEMSVSCFNEKVDEFYNLLQINKVVQVSGFRVKPVEEKYQKIAGQGLEIVLECNGAISESSEDIEPIGFNFIDILQIHALTIGSLVDVLGIAYQAEEMVEGTSGTGKQFAFRKILFTDRTEMQYAAKVWGDSARKLILEKPTVFVLRRGKVECYESDKYINVSGSSLCWLNPSLPEADELNDWLTKRLSQQ